VHCVCKFSAYLSVLLCVSAFVFVRCVYECIGTVCACAVSVSVCCALQWSMSLISNASYPSVFGLSVGVCCA